jgi:hypothetical protein
MGRETFWFFDVPLLFYPYNTVLKQALTSHDFSSVLWNPNVGTGFPLWAEGQVGQLYWLNWVMVVVFDPLVAYNVEHFIHYLLVAVFTYVYMRSLKLQSPSALVSAVAFTFSGHLVGAMAASPMLRSAVWLPLMFWGVERFATRRKFIYLATASMGMAMQVFGGYVTLAALGGVATVCYGIFCLAADSVSEIAQHPSNQGVWGRSWRAIGVVGVMGIMGLALAAGHLFPQLELVPHSQRAWASYDYVTNGSLPPIQLSTLIWPLVFYNPVNHVVWGLENLGRTAIYVGIVPLALAVIAIVVRPRPRRVTFFIWMTLVAMVLALGRYTPLYRWLYVLPGFHNLRVPGTFGYLVDFSLAVLAGHGMDLLLSQPALRLDRRLIVLSGVLLALTLPILGWQVAVQRWAATGRLVEKLEPLRSWMKPGLDPALLLHSIQTSADWRQATAFMPLILLIMAAGWLILSRTRLSLRVWAWCGVGLVAVDVAFFAATLRETQVASYSAAEVRSWVTDILEKQPGIYRIAVTWGLYPWYNSHQPNRLMTDDIATLQVYAQLSTRRLSQYVSLASQNPSMMAKLLGLANVRYALDTESQVYAGVPFIVKRPLAEAGVWRDARADVTLPTPMQATRMQLIFAETSWRAPDSNELAQVELVSKGGQKQSWTLRDGMATAAGAGQVSVRLIDQPALRYPLSWRGEDFTVQEWPLYYAEINPTLAAPLAKVTIMPQPQTNLYLLGLSVESAEGRWIAGEQPFHQVGFSPFYQQSHGTIYQVERALPRAYVVHQVRVVSDSQSGPALLDSSFDPQYEALVTEGPKSTFDPKAAANDDVEIMDYRPTRVDITVDLSAPGLLVLTDSNYPGWQVFVDGIQRPIISTNYLFRGVYVDNGKHHVTFVYAPVSIRIGMMVSLTAAIGVIGLIVIELLRSRRQWMSRSSFQV